MPKIRTAKKEGLHTIQMLPASDAGSYEEAIQGIDEPRMTKVSVTVDRGLLSLVDHYVQSHRQLSRSEIFDTALETWARQIQKQSDAECYSKTVQSKEQRQATDDWSAIQTEAAKHIW